MTSTHETPPTVKILCFGPCSDMAEIFLEIAQDVSPAGTLVSFDNPYSVQEDDFWALAAKGEFDAILLLTNNIRYSNISYEAGSSTDAEWELAVLNLVEKAVRLFHLPVLALYGYPSRDEFALELKKAGATAALRIPCTAEPFGEAFRLCLYHS